MWRFHQKFKRYSKTHSSWSKKEIGDMFINVKNLEEKVHFVEEKFILDQSEYNKNSIHE